MTQSGRPLLIVDDDADFAESLFEMLEPHGYTVETADTAESAFAALQATAAPVALIDIRLGADSGVDVLASLRSARPELIAVMMTAHVETETVIKALRTGAYDYIDKGSSPAEFVAVLDRAFEKRQLQDERRDAYEALRLAKESAEAASRSKSEFLATMSHELRTPLNAIIGFSEVMMSETFGPLGEGPYREYAQDINVSGIHLLALINDILDLSKAESGKLELNEETVDLAEVVEQVARLIRPRADGGQVSVATKIAAGLPFLRGDERKLKQIALNLVSNAVKFTPKGGHVDLELDCDEARRLVLRVRDTGIGIAPEDIERAFEPFRQIDSELSRQHDGTGLGLPLTAAMVRLHEAELAVDSAVGRGTLVTVLFPPERTIAEAAAA
jgi:signal transduction histidine kinase